MIGKTNSMSGGDIKPEIVKVQLKTNQSSHTDIVGAKITVNYASVSEVYTWEGSDISIKIPPYLSYTISVNDIDGYKTPDTYNSMAIGGTTKAITFEYKCTIVTVEMDDNQPSYNDVSTATATISSSGMTTKTISNGGTAKVPTGASCTITWSAVSGYRTPDKQTFTTSGTSVSKTGIYQTEILTVTVTSDIDLPARYTITVSGIGSQTTASKVYKVPFGTSYTVSASAADGYSTPTSQSFTANSESRAVTMEYLEYVVPVDLSLQDIFGAPTSQTTANCYVVKAKGMYKFPLVYGNAIKNGSTNSAAYTKVAGDYSHDFVNHLDAVITSPYIEMHANCTASSVELSMADTPSVFTKLSIVTGNSCRYIQFKVDSVPSTGANGVISVKDSSGTVMWSWHIWVWADDLTPVTITNNTGVNYNILPVNLATKKDASTSGKMYNWFYQWGRPTPMLPPTAYNSTTDATNYGVKTFAKKSKASSYGVGIQNPQNFYYDSTKPYNWFGTAVYYNLWDANCVSTGYSDNNVVKTVYDPCPVGFKIPNGNTFTYFSKTNAVGSFNNGWYFKRNSSDKTGVFFPASGNRYFNNGNLDGVGSFGGVWLSASSYQPYASLMNFSWSTNLSTVNSQTENRRVFGYSVRPVQE